MKENLVRIGTARAAAGAVLSLVLCFLAGGCATSTVESRKTERLAAYNALAVEDKALVDRGQIRIGMGEDAVYIAWGPPAQVLLEESAGGKTSTWLYHGQWMEETRYWTYREVSRDGTTFLERYLDRDYNPREYVRAEIVMVDGKVARWRTLAKPTR